MGPADPTTDQGNLVTFDLLTQNKLCALVDENGKVYLETSRKSAKKSCTVSAVAPTTSPNFKQLSVQNTVRVSP